MEISDLIQIDTLGTIVNTDPGKFGGALIDENYDSEDQKLSLKKTKLKKMIK